MALCADNDNSVGSQGAHDRRHVRSCIAKSHFTRAQREVMMVVVDIWFDNKKCGFMQPGREKIAKLVRVTTRTVSRTLGILRDCGALVAMANARGEGGQPTRYIMNVDRLISAARGK